MCFMKEEFTVLHDRVPVGKAEVIRQGLYYRISCRYRLPSGEVNRLIAKWPGGWENIGIPVPEGDGFYLFKKLPVKKLPGTDVSFHLIALGPYPVDNEQGTGPDTDAVVVKAAVAEEITDVAPDLNEKNNPERHPIREDQPFDDLDRLENSRSETVEGQTYAIFEDKISDVQTEANRTMVGTEDIGIDRCGEDVVSESV